MLGFKNGWWLCVGTSADLERDALEDRSTRLWTEKGANPTSEEDDFIILDDDIKKSTVNDLLLIEFSNKINQMLIKHMATSVVIKFLARMIGFAVLQNRIYRLLKPSKPL